MKTSVASQSVCLVACYATHVTVSCFPISSLTSKSKQSVIATLSPMPLETGLRFEALVAAPVASDLSIRAEFDYGMAANHLRIAFRASGRKQQLPTMWRHIYLKIKITLPLSWISHPEITSHVNHNYSAVTNGLRLGERSTDSKLIFGSPTAADPQRATEFIHAIGDNFEVHAPGTVLPAPATEQHFKSSSLASLDVFIVAGAASGSNAKATVKNKSPKDA